MTFVQWQPRTDHVSFVVVSGLSNRKWESISSEWIAYRLVECRRGIGLPPQGKAVAATLVTRATTEDTEIELLETNVGADEK